MLFFSIIISYNDIYQYLSFDKNIFFTISMAFLSCNSLLLEQKSSIIESMLISKRY